MSVQNLTESWALRRSFKHLPPEIVHIIFEHAIPPNFVVDLSASFTPNSLWCRVLQRKLSLTNVCWAWYRIGVPFLYGDVAIRRIYQLGNLLRTLESSDSSHLKDLIKALNVHCFIPHSFHDSFMIQLAQLFKICPRLTSFSCTLPCSALPPLPPTLTLVELGKERHLSALQGIFKLSSTNLVSLSLYMGCYGHCCTSPYSFPRLESLAFEFGMGKRLSCWELPRLRHLTFRTYFRPKGSGGFLFGALKPFLKKNGAQLKFLHIHPKTECGCMSKFIFDMEGILKLCPSLERFVLYPRPVPPITDQHIRWFEVGNDIWDSQFPHTSPGHSIVIGAFPSLKTLREPSQRWSGWNACFRDLKSSFPHVVRGIGGVQECMGLDIHDDVGEIFVHISDMWTDDSADGGYESSSTMEEDDSDSESESDWDIGSEKDFKDPEAPMDLLNSC